MKLLLTILSLSLFSHSLFATHSLIESQMRSPASLKPQKFSVKACNHRPFFLKYTRSEILPGIENLPKALLVANRIEHYIESPRTAGKPMRLYWNYSLKQRKSEGISPEICGTLFEKDSYQLSLTAPTLLDLTSKKTQGHSLWRFETVIEGTQVSLWNRPTKILAETPLNLERDINAEYRFYQLSQNQIELFIEKDIDGVQNYLSIIFDVVLDTH